MQLVQLLLPLHDPRGRRRRALLAEVMAELTARFGGVTAHARAPAMGLWRPPGRRGAKPVRDDIVVVEVMTARLDARWWRAYRQRLEARFGQDEIVLWAQAVRRL